MAVDLIAAAALNIATQAEAGHVRAASKGRGLTARCGKTRSVFSVSAICGSLARITAKNFAGPVQLPTLGKTLPVDVPQIRVICRHIHCWIITILV
jgi:hypothetical protein